MIPTLVYTIMPTRAVDRTLVLGGSAGGRPRLMTQINYSADSATETQESVANLIKDKSDNMGMAKSQSRERSKCYTV